VARRAQPDRPEQLAALERPLAVDAVRALVTGAVIHRAHEGAEVVDAQWRASGQSGARSGDHVAERGVD